MYTRLTQTKKHHAKRYSDPSQRRIPNKIHPVHGYVVCGAKDSTNEYGFCLSKPRADLGNGMRCRKHNRGNNGRPITTGLYTHKLPPQLAKALLDIENSHELADMKQKLAILQLFLNEKLTNWAKNAENRQLEPLRKPHARLMLAIASSNLDDIKQAFHNFSEAMEKCLAERHLEQEVRQLIREIKDVATVQNYREAAKEKTLTVREIHAIALAMVNAVVDCVADPGVLLRVQSKFDAIFDQPGFFALEASSGEHELIPSDIEFRELEDTNDGARETTV